MTTKELIDTYDIRDGATMGKPGALFIARDTKVVRDKMLNEIKARKPEILAYYATEREAKANAKAAREARIKAIDGLADIKAAIADFAAWQREFNASFEGEGAVGGLGVRNYPEHDIDAMMQRYPHAAAYLRAEEYANKTNYELATIGKKALEAVIDGDWQAAMAKMDKDIDAYTTRHMWD